MAGKKLPHVEEKKPLGEDLSDVMLKVEHDAWLIIKGFAEGHIPSVEIVVQLLERGEEAKKQAEEQDVDLPEHSFYDALFDLLNKVGTEHFVEYITNSRTEGLVGRAEDFIEREVEKIEAEAEEFADDLLERADLPLPEFQRRRAAARGEAAALPLRAPAEVKPVLAEVKQVSAAFKATAAASRARLDRLIDRRGVDGLKEMYDDAIAGLTQKLNALVAAGRDDTMTAYQMRLLLGQAKLGVAQIMQRMTGALGEASEDVQVDALRGIIDDIARLEQQFTGAEITLPVEEAATFRGVIDANRTSLLQAHASSMARYGAALVDSMEGELSKSLLLGETAAEAVQRINDVGGLEWWQGERIVRTELAWAYNATHATAISESAKEFPDLMMRWQEFVSDDDYAPLDKRVGVDSIAMHGQVAPPGGRFTMPPDAPHADADGNTDVPDSLVGKSWTHPPNRPNDRAVLVPWRPDWGIPGWEWKDGARVPVEAPPPPVRVAPTEMEPVAEEPSEVEYQPEWPSWEDMPYFRPPPVRRM